MKSESAKLTVELLLRGDPPVLDRIKFGIAGQTPVSTPKLQDRKHCKAVAVVLTKFRAHSQLVSFRIRSTKSAAGFIHTILNARNETTTKSAICGLAVSGLQGENNRFLSLFLGPTESKKSRDYLDVDVVRIQPEDVTIKLDGTAVSDSEKLEELANTIAADAGWELADYCFDAVPVSTAADTEKPPPAAEEKTPHNLPGAPVRFFGHEQLRQEVAAKLAENGLIVFHETGGMGKTTIANQTAHDAIRSGQLSGGAVWIDCESNPAFEQSIRTMAEVLMGSGMEACSVEECRKRLDDYFSHRHTLIVFDNFETVLTNGDFNEFVRGHATKCSIVITAREIHDGMIPHVHPLHELATPDAIQLFLYEATLTPCSEEDVEIVAKLCDAVGNIPLAVVLLARQAPKATLQQLADELRKNTDMLATDDAFLDARHRSITACFLTSFERLSAEDRDTLFRLSVVPHGLGKQLAASYLDKPTWLASLTNCLHSAMLKLEGDRYAFHPLVRTFLHNRMGSRKDEWECGFVDFFCRLLNAATHGASDISSSDSLHDEVGNCEAALRKASDSNRYEHLVLVLELLPEAWHSLGKLPLSEAGFDFAAAEEASQTVIRLLESALADAKRREDDTLLEKLLVLQFEYFFHQCRSVDDREKALEELVLVNAPRAEALRWSAAARDYVAESELEMSAFELAEEALVKAAAIWETLRESFPGEFEACLLNLFTVRVYLKKHNEAAKTSRILFDTLHGNSYCVEGIVGTAETMPEIDWAQDGARRLEFLTASAERRKERFYRLAEKIGETLFRLEQWAAAEPWLKEIVAWKERDPWNVDLPLWEYHMMPLAKVWAKLGRLEEAEAAFYSIARSTRRRDDAYTFQQLNELNREAHIEIAKVEAQRGSLDKAIERAADVLEAWKLGDLYPYAEPTEEEIKELSNAPEFRKISNMISEWKRLAKDGTKPKRAK